ncbi:hypothetical protein ACVWZW_001889 [Bradyrhizobium sp. F1.13.4]
MRPLSGMIMIAAVSTWTGLHATPAVGQTFNDRWSIVPKAHAEPAPEGLDQTKKEEPQAQSPNGQEPKDRSGAQSFNRFISGKASYYSYSTRQDSERFIV